MTAPAGDDGPWAGGVTDAEATAHLRAADAALARAIGAAGPEALERRAATPERSDHYGSLVRAIVGQQLSTKAAAAIYARLLARFGGRPPTPDEVLAADAEELRAAAGLSRAKVRYLRSLAEHVVGGELELERLDELDDDAIITELVAVKGIGEWSAHMFLIFHLRRPDVLAPGDLGIRRAVQIWHGLEDLPARGQLEAIADPWRPYRSIACRYLWRSLAATPEI